MKVILDTNIIISGIFFGGPPSLILEAWHKNKFKLVISKDIIKEYSDLAEKKYQLDCVKAKTQETIESWIAGVIFVMNIAARERIDSFVYIFRCAKNLSQRLFEILNERKISEKWLSMA